MGAYLVQEKLGEGVSCHVYRGWDETRSCPVALKILNWANVYDRPAAMKQLRMEAAALSRVNHPLVVRFIDFGFDPRWPYLVTEYFEGRPLGDLLRAGGALPPAWALYLISQVVDALGAVWQAGVVHRDIKPDNVLVGPNGNGKLIDFGLAKAEAIQSNQTGPELAGTAAYVAPEQAKDASTVDHRADIYSLGVTFYETLTGRLPFEGPQPGPGDLPTSQQPARASRTTRTGPAAARLRLVLVDAGQEPRRPPAELPGTPPGLRHRPRRNTLRSGYRVNPIPDTRHTRYPCYLFVSTFSRGGGVRKRWISSSCSGRLNWPPSRKSPVETGRT